jgi:O-antigen ligase
VIGAAPARARRTPLLLTLYVAVILVLFATHLDLYLHETKQLDVNTIHLVVAACLPFLATLLVGPDPDRLLARCLEALNASAVPVMFFVMWMAGHVLLMGGTVLPERVDFTFYFPLFQLSVLLFGLCLACTPGFVVASRPAGSAAILVLGGTVLYDAFHPGSFSLAQGRGAGLAMNANTAGYDILLLLALTTRFGEARLWDAILLGVGLVSLFFTFSRGGILLSIVLLAAYVGSLAASRDTRAAARLAIPALGLLVAVAATTWLVQNTAIVHVRGSIDRLGWFESGTTAPEQESRIELMQHYWRLIEQRPILGYGTGGMEAAAALAPSGQGPHNQYLRVWLDHGLWGLTAYLGLLLSALALFVARRSWSGATLVTITLANGLFSHDITEDKTFLLLFGAALAASALDPGPSAGAVR